VKLIVGLGNPGPRYACTRHNIGFIVAQRLATDCGIALKRQGYQGLYGVGRCAETETTILLPQTFMNVSGTSVVSACKSLGVSPGDLIVIHDDLDLSPGALRIKMGGGHGGHNGIRSISALLGTSDYLRVKMGIGRPPPGRDIADYVLSNFADQEKDCLETLVDNAIAAIKVILRENATAAMNRFNSSGS
jgi:peptidyl-tRNA hydrolase, PTH1 family